jgi:hypothetical protein
MATLVLNTKEVEQNSDQANQQDIVERVATVEQKWYDSTTIAEVVKNAIVPMRHFAIDNSGDGSINLDFDFEGDDPSVVPVTVRAGLNSHPNSKLNKGFLLPSFLSAAYTMRAWEYMEDGLLLYINPDEVEDYEYAKVGYIRHDYAGQVDLGVKVRAPKDDETWKTGWGRIERINGDTKITLLVTDHGGRKFKGDRARELHERNDKVFNFLSLTMQILFEGGVEATYYPDRWGKCVEYWYWLNNLREADPELAALISKQHMFNGAKKRAFEHEIRRELKRQNPEEPAPIAPDVAAILVGLTPKKSYYIVYPGGLRFSQFIAGTAAGNTKVSNLIKKLTAGTLLIVEA